MEIKVLGPGCANCEALYKATLNAVEQLGKKDISINYVKNMDEVTKYVMITPGLVINEIVVHEGKPIPNVEQIKKIISEFL